ncbi:MAG: septal ring lytic transglycosylase RlpA family protein [Candidatus Omnitrophica bacterium]|nr:septal ring lytic transglycosylase RlpA family protein [Candidatus Omnitrophota bacterium]
MKKSPLFVKSFVESFKQANLHAKAFFSMGFIFLIMILIRGYNIQRIGTASWYGGGEKLNKHTASGEVFDPGLLTCASWDYPFGTFLKVTNLYNNKEVIVRVNDRGPAKYLHRLVDLSRRSFSVIAPLRKGLIKVKIDVYNKEEGKDEKS